MSVYSVVLDITCLIIGGLVIYKGFRDGLLCSVVSLVGTILVMAISLYFSGKLAGWAFSAFVERSLLEGVENFFAGHVDLAEITPALSEFLEQLPGFLSEMLFREYGGRQEFLESLQSGALHTVTDLSGFLVDRVISPLITSLLQVCICLILFIIGMILVRIAANLFRSFDAVPILGGINSLLGGLLGACQAAIMLYILALLVKFVIIMSGSQWEWLNWDVLTSTHILRFFADIPLL